MELWSFMELRSFMEFIKFDRSESLFDDLIEDEFD
jgi:hypothetical protein